MKRSTPRDGKRKERGGPASSDVHARDDRSLRAENHRNSVLAHLTSRAGGMSLDDLIGTLGLSRLSQQEQLAKELVEMTRGGRISLGPRGRYHIVGKPGGTRPSERGDVASPDRVGSMSVSAGKRKATRRAAKVGTSRTPLAESHSRSIPTSSTGTSLGIDSLVTGRVVAHRDGYGFLMPGENRSAEDIFLPPKEMQGLMHGDQARVRITGVDARGRREGILVEVLERAHMTVVGRLHVDGDTAILLPSNPRTQNVLIPKEHLAGAQQGQMVVAELLTQPGDRAAPVGRITEILGKHLEAGMEIETAIRAYHLPYTWSRQVKDEANSFDNEVSSEQMKGREDLRALPLVTIDGADARDFDDALYAEAAQSRRGGWKLWVAIADVSAYVRSGSALDEHAQMRGTSVYFPEHVLPMLPEKLSNGLCSLNPGVDRLCMACELRVDRDGQVFRSRFFPAVMRSHGRLLYEQVAEALDDPRPTAISTRHPELIRPLRALNEAFEALYRARSRRGAIDFDSSETKIVFGKSRKIESIVPVTRTRAHRLVEECMIAANVEAAKLVEKHGIPSLYRVHVPPDPTKVAELRVFLGGRGVKLGGGSTPKATDFAETLASLHGRPDAGVIQIMMLRSLMQARYSPDNVGHFGLALTHYAHFTSPIRRYPDLLLHRAIKLIAGKRRRKEFPYTHQQMVQLGALCSMAERRAEEATRDVDAWLKCEYMSHRVGDEFDAVVTGVASFGLFVELIGVYVDGMVHISRLGRDFFEYDQRHQRLVGGRSGRIFGLGEKLRVKVARVSLDERKIDLEPVEDIPRRREQGKVHRQTGSAEVKPAGQKRKRGAGRSRRTGGTVRGGTGSPRKKKG